MDSAGTSDTTALKRNSKDVAWDYGILVNPKNVDKVKCKLCGKEFSGGAYRIKEHIANIPGNISACPKSSKDDKEKCKNAIEEAKKKKQKKVTLNDELRESVNVQGTGDLEDEIALEEIRSRKVSRTLGPMDRFATNIDPESRPLPARQQTISDAIWKEKLHKVQQYISRWVYASGVPFNAIANDEFTLMVEAIGKYGPGVTPPSQYQLREPLLKEEVERINGLLKPQEEELKKNGCTIMTDAWTDQKRRSIMNLCINSKGGTMFRSSKDCSDESHTGAYIFEYVNRCIEEVGEENVVQVVTDNATNNMAAAKMLKEIKPTIFWTSCATHSINLMLESLSRLPKFKSTIQMAKKLTIFIYAHHKTLALMRSFTKRRDIVRPGVTRFASSFLTLQSLLEKRDKLAAMFSSSEWRKSKWSNHQKGLMAFTTVMSVKFWNGVIMCLKVFGPLVKVLRLVDGDTKHTMGFLHGELIEAKKEISIGLKHVEKNVQPIMAIIDARIRGRLDNPLHLTGYLLNPYYFYRDSSQSTNGDIKNAMFKCLEAFFPNDITTQCHVINSELAIYQNKEGNFGKPWAILGCKKENYDPVYWWETYGSEVPSLAKMARRILSLTTSSSGCERNWSTFEGIHTKKRNRLDVSRMNNLVFVQFNAKLMSQKKKRKEKNIDILLADHATNAQSWIVDGISDDVGDSGFGLQGDIVDEESRREETYMDEIRELHEEEFISDDEEFLDIDCESDGDLVTDGDLILQEEGDEDCEDLN